MPKYVNDEDLVIKLIQNLRFGIRRLEPGEMVMRICYN